MPIKSKATTNKGTSVISTSSTGPPKWKQSPIDLNEIHTWTEKFTALVLNGHWLKEGEATMTNTGNTVKIQLSKRTLPSIFDGPLKDNYQFANLQFRWGSGNARGAEHSVNNLWYSMEAQAIHWNTRYGSIEKCYDKSDGIAILSFFLQVVGCPESPDNPCLASITDFLPQIKKAGAIVSIASDCMRWILVPCLTTTGYYTYSGSLTSPPYSECVTWIVVPRPIQISARQVDAFRGLCDVRSNPILESYRAQRPLNGRRIYYAID